MPDSMVKCSDVKSKPVIDFSKGNSKTVVTGYWIHLEINEEENNK